MEQGQSRSTAQFGRPTRIRRSAKNYDGAVSWKEVARDLTTGDDEEMNSDSHGAPSEEFSEDLSDSADEYQPEEEHPTEPFRRLAKKKQAQDKSDSDHESQYSDGISSDEDQESTYNQYVGNRTIQPIPALLQGENLLSKGYGGLQSSLSWREAGQNIRQRQRDKDLSSNDEAEFEEEAIQSLAKAFSNTDSTTGGAQLSTNQDAQWNAALHADEDPEEDMDESAFQQDVRGAVGFRRRPIRDSQGRMRRAPREQALSPEVRQLLSQANTAYVIDDKETTVAKLQEIIRLDPTVRSAWGTLAVCFAEQGMKERSLQCRILEASLASHPLSLWVEAANASVKLGYLEQASYCLQKAIKASQEKDRSDVIDLMWERAHLLCELLDLQRGASVFSQMLKYRPYNREIITALIPVLFSLNKLTKAIDVLQSCADWNMIAFPNPQIDPTLLNEELGPDAGSTYGASEIATLTDLYLKCGKPYQAIDTLRKGARWLDGRGSETFWNEVEDDREFDVDRTSRTRLHGRHIELAAIHDLDPELRFYLGVARARLGAVIEAKHHFDIWSCNVDVSDSMDHFGEIVDEYLRAISDSSVFSGMTAIDAKKEEKARKDALDEALQISLNLVDEDRDQLDDTSVFRLASNCKRVAECYIAQGCGKDAMEYLQTVIQIDPNDLESKMRLAEQYEENSQRNEAIELVGEVMRAKREKQNRSTLSIREEEKQGPQTQSFFMEQASQKQWKARQSDKEQRRHDEAMRESDTVLAWKRLQLRNADVFVPAWWRHDVRLNIDGHLLPYGCEETREEVETRSSAVTEWLSDAEALVTMFMNTKQLFPRDKSKRFQGVIRTKRRRADQIATQAQAMMLRLGDTEINESSVFRGVSVDDWISLLAQYALVLTKVDEYDNAIALLDQAGDSTVIYNNYSRKQMIALCKVSCALYARDAPTVVDSLKLFITSYQFHNEPLRIMLTIANSTGFYTQAAFSAPSNLKTFLRRSRIHESIVQGCRCSFNTSTRKWVVRDKLSASSRGRLQKRGEKGRPQDRDGEEDEYDDASDEDDAEQEGSFFDAQDSSRDLTDKSGKAKDVWPLLKHMEDATKYRPPSRYNPANDMFYADHLLNSSNGVPSLAYWIRIVAHQHNDPLICLTAAVACLCRATNRQVDNRHQVILQAFTLLHYYRQLRVAESQRAEKSEKKPYDHPEVDYNFGRAAHHVGLYQIAEPHYKSALRKSLLESSTQMIGFDAMAESAFNLHLIYVAAGNMKLANHIMERYLLV